MFDVSIFANLKIIKKSEKPRVPLAAQSLILDSTQHKNELGIKSNYWLTSQKC